MTTVEAFLNSSGSPSAKFPTIGVTVKGTILDTEVMQQTDFQTGQPKTCDNGEPMMQLVVTLETEV